MRRSLLPALFTCALLVLPVTHASAFTGAQIQSLLSLLTAFNVPSATVAHVGTILQTQVSTPPIPTWLEEWNTRTVQNFGSGGFTLGLGQGAPAPQPAATPDPEPEPEPYVAQAIHFEANTALRDTDETMVVTDGAAGFFSVFIRRIAGQGAAYFLQSGSTILSFGVDGAINFEFSDYDTDNYIYTFTESNVIAENEWAHVLVAWNTNFAAGSRLIALYVNDIFISYTIDDDVGNSFFTSLDQERTVVLSNVSAPKQHDFADFGLWVGSSIVETNGTITTANRRKFIDADGKPVSPTSWPANPVLKFSGGASAFATNQGSGGDFEISSGSITNATTSPSD